ncbi:MAG: hypothetical protein K9H48_12305 [Melioribacteraceae bacterium]|nr:hypothetical protein [Melioribacteraceae bacterium]MCF8395076.1 hypothetical protein [Melioribacteraceae bacterium]MCF8420377.1 hypothetical protein [Melioribacteraceae bacterium]
MSKKRAPILKKKLYFIGTSCDTETNYDYFGARYYSSKLGLWNSVDPLADKYPGWSPYNYVRNNPLARIDLLGLSDTTFTHTLPLITVTASSSSTASLPIWITTGWGIAVSEPTPVGEIMMGVGTGAYLTYYLYNILSSENTGENADGKEHTPDTHPEEFENVRKSKAKKHKESGEIWEKDQLHKDHWEIYKNKKMWEKGIRSRNVWDNGTHKPFN